MNIILVSDNLAKGRTYALGRRQVLWLAGMWALSPLVLAVALSYLMLFHAADLPHPFLQSLVLSAQKQEMEKNRAYVQENLNAMAVKLGQIQAQVLRLDALGERLSKLGGVSRQEFDFGQVPGRGGAESSLPQRELSMDEFGQQLSMLTKRLDDQADRLGLMEAMLLQKQLKKVALPTGRPVNLGWYSSNFGWRIDPFTGKQAYHEGVDFMALPGTPIYAAGGGIVVFAEQYAGYGNMIDIDHGNGLISRYAHASKLLVKVGDVVLKGQKIALVGNTGRSTGPHLHFEVRYKGAPQNPEHYLHASSG
jgi:murein DD-endopeptidase MepM/ murein hydrolase activator NlpD